LGLMVIDLNGEGLKTGKPRKATGVWRDGRRSWGVHTDLQPADTVLCNNITYASTVISKARNFSSKRLEGLPRPTQLHGYQRLFSPPGVKREALSHPLSVRLRMSGAMFLLPVCLHGIHGTTPQPVTTRTWQT
jgi:hypothetical protein